MYKHTEKISDYYNIRTR